MKNSPKKESSFTADIVAFARTFSGIPLCREIFDIAEELDGPLDPKEKTRTNERPHMLPYVEARYLLTDDTLERSGITQVFETASGLSPRGYLATDEPGVGYIEIDLPDKMDLKRRVVDELHRRRNTAWPRNHSLVKGDVTDDYIMRVAELHFSPEPIFIITEGLLRYMTFPDKEKFAGNVRRIMEYHPGSVWMTTDIHILSDVESSAETRAHYDRVATDWGMDLRPNLFRDFDHARAFFRGFGFTIKERSFAEMAPRLVVPKRFKMNEGAVLKELKRRKAFVMTL